MRPAAVLLGALAAAAAAVLGAHLERARTRRALHDARTACRDLHGPELQRLGEAEAALAEADRALVELRESIPKVWDAAIAAARQSCQYHHAGDGLAVWEIPPDWLRPDRRSN